MKIIKMIKKVGIIICTVFILSLCVANAVHSQPLSIPGINIETQDLDEDQSLVLVIQILALLTVLSLAPAIILLTTAFTRLVIVLSFIRNALALQQTPPNKVLIGLAIFLTVFVMAPTWQVIQDEALTPYLDGELGQEEALNSALYPLRDFMFSHTRETDLALFINATGMERPESPNDVPTHMLIPAFVLSELKTAFQIGFVIFVPFLVIDMVIASTLMSMGMMMLPPVMISLPFKILLFVMVDGWSLVVRSLLMGY